MARVFVLWNEKYNTGIKEIDDQHKKLVNILNQLYESFVDRTTNEKLKKVFKEDIEEGKVSVTFQLMNFLRSWLIEHINGTDRKYIGLFKEKGL